MNTFFIAPIIPFKIFLTIQKEKDNIKLSNDELKIIDNLNILFDYSKYLSDDIITGIVSIVKKIDEYKKTNLFNKLNFTNQNRYNEIPTYNYLIYELLIERKYIQILNTDKVKSLTTSFGLSDIGPSTNSNINFNNFNDDEKNIYIKDFLEYSHKKDKIHTIMAKSKITSKINTLTRILSNKNILYNLLEGEDYIPTSSYFNTTDDDVIINNVLNNFKKNNKSQYYVLKPSMGTLSDGVVIKDMNELNLEFIKNWIIKKENNIYSKGGNYSSWILSSFIESFLWKLKGISNTSKYFNNIPELNGHSFNDNIGRINKFRFFCLWTIIDGKFVSYLYKNGYAEMALEELTNYSRSQLDPSDVEQYYLNLLNVSENSAVFQDIQLNKVKDNKLEAATVGTYLDFARVVNESNYPMGKDAWNKVISNMYIIINTLLKKTKKYMSCINKNSKFKNSGCYSYFALDIIIDSNNKPWLLEANSKPFIGMF